MYDDASEEDDYEGRERRRRAEIPVSSTLYVKGIPEEKTEADLMAHFSAKYPGLRGVRLILDRGTGLSRGFAFLVRAMAACVDSGRGGV